MSHPLDDWIAGLRPLSHGSLRAYVVESWFEEPGEPASWSPEQVRLARTIFRPSPDDTRELLDAWMMLDEDDEDEETKELRNAWLCPAGPLLEVFGHGVEVVEPRRDLPDLTDVLVEHVLQAATLGAPNQRAIRPGRGGRYLLTGR